MVREHHLHFIDKHPIEHYFNHITQDIKNRFITSLGIAFVLMLVSQIYPICTEKMCYTIFAQIFFNPVLLLKPFAFNFILVPSFFMFMIFALLWFGILSVMAAIQRVEKLPGLIIPALSIIIFIYMIFLVSGTLGSLFLHTGLVECINNDDCVRAGYVGEVCTSVYRPVYTVFSLDNKPLTSCSCIQNKCIGS